MIDLRSREDARGVVWRDARQIIVGVARAAMLMGINAR
jgi:hypothetical protein